MYIYICTYIISCTGSTKSNPSSNKDLLKNLDFDEEARALFERFVYVYIWIYLDISLDTYI
jgi:hypothetical protein